MGNCSPTSCPEGESICVAFGVVQSNVSGCANTSRPSPYLRTYCMKTCEEDSDCRVGYECHDFSKENPWGGVVIQEEAKDTRICIAPQSGAPIEEDRKNEVCTGPQEEGAAGAPAL